MKRFLTIFGITIAVFLLSIGALRQSMAQHEKLAKAYVTEGLYDEALQEYHHFSTTTALFKSTIRLFGEFNAFLAIVGLFFIAGGFLIKKPLSKNHVNRIRITKNLNT
ncbi:MAG: hypothetical protein A2Z91_05360 [Deltaproteobacteria bacterium GWA2_38_16]|nr:MAG: hypothetical protein A2Z91_05360 [Deltaproteobacteria bacterium GWA2_38_16]OGQ03206.1 MAG: hypothetical protein A3D19_04090 [Deltaproteobacteria bacterium RIFCSPHIGHO2_02_FULL_38_15]OGQ34659.1 MAG: hypothetical protein A3A72_00800 [Deltaproteobacteria bacterium RIFCSPLOWO2_01_FULL_38_9]OGQ59799.1 MAG: hypothetical protein A3G92_02805 [Deltaproteobacteria bacterium RIFCSPLOWO2_12_FULL_38_8]HBQ20368.1 hypothetical protein [Deltaproteobacteria bacterium]